MDVSFKVKKGEIACFPEGPTAREDDDDAHPHGVHAGHDGTAKIADIDIYDELRSLRAVTRTACPCLVSGDAGVLVSSLLRSVHSMKRGEHG